MIIFIVISLSGSAIKHFSGEDGVRSISYKIAWDNFIENIIFGYDQVSTYTKTYQELFWYEFSPSDLGIVGIAFKYGLIGLGLYIFFALYRLPILAGTVRKS